MIHVTSANRRNTHRTDERRAKEREWYRRKQAQIEPKPLEPNVEWRDIMGYPGYAVTIDGRVLSRFWSFRGPPRTTFRRWLKPYPHRNGYLLVDLGKKTAKVHRLVLEAFVGPCPAGMEACHGDGDKTNNHLSNLRWDTAKNNSQDKIRHGTNIGLRGEASTSAKLTEQQVTEIRRRCASGESQKAIADDFGVTATAVGCIVRRQTWQEVNDGFPPFRLRPPYKPAGSWASWILEMKPGEHRDVVKDDYTGLMRTRLTMGVQMHGQRISATHIRIWRDS